MAYIDQTGKAKIAAALKQVMPPGWKYSLRVENYSMVVLTITEAPIDLIGEMNAKMLSETHAHTDRILWRSNHSQIDHDRPDAYFLPDRPAFAVITAVGQAMRAHDWFDRSDTMTDYAHTAYYIRMNVGRDDRPFVCNAPEYQRRKLFEAEMFRLFEAGDENIFDVFQAKGETEPAYRWRHEFFSRDNHVKHCIALEFQRAQAGESDYQDVYDALFGATDDISEQAAQARPRG